MKAIEKHRSRRGYFGAAALACLVAMPVLAAIGCGGVATQPPAVGGESHFLEKCDGICADGLDCIGGVCTQGCLVSEMSSCSEFTGAACTAASVEPGAVAVCDVACGGNDINSITLFDCSELGSAHRCEAGYCRAPNRGSGGTGGTSTGTENGGASGTASGGAGGSSVNTGGVAGSDIVGTAMGGAGPGVDCSMYRNLTDPRVLEMVVRNERSTPIYVQAMQENACQGPPVLIERAGSRVELSSGPCGTSCEGVQDSGATGPGDTSIACPAECSALPLLPIEPGEERTLRVDALELVFLQMPNACFEGDFDSVTCFTRISLPPAEYTVSLNAFTDYACLQGFSPCSCQPDDEGLCVQNVGAGETLTATTSFVRPSPNNMIDISLTTVSLTFGP